MLEDVPSFFPTASVIGLFLDVARRTFEPSFARPFADGLLVGGLAGCQPVGFLRIFYVEVMLFALPTGRKADEFPSQDSLKL